ncbi:MAG: PAS domain S-box protein [Ignavibacteriaceae bacterium]
MNIKKSKNIIDQYKTNPQLLKTMKDQNSEPENHAKINNRNKRNSANKSEIKFLLLFKSHPYIAIIFDKKGSYLKVSDSSPQHLQQIVPTSELLGETICDILPKNQASYIINGIKKTIKTKNTVTIKFKLSDRYTEQSIYGIILPADNNAAILLAHKIPDRKKTVKADKESLRLFRLVWENSNDGMRLTNKQGKILMVNKTYCQLVNKKRSELEGKPITVVYGKEFKDQAPLIHQDRFENTRKNSYFEYEVTLWNEKIIWLGISSSFFEIENKEPCLLSIFNNITERKQNEFKTNQAISLLNATLESTADGIFVVNLKGEITWLNQKFIKMWNIPFDLTFSKSEIKLLEFLKTNLKEPDAFIARINWLYEHPESESIDTLEFFDGKTFERYSIPQKLNNNIVGRVWSFHDITEKKISEEALIESEKRFRSLFEASAEGICILSDKYEECNVRFSNLLGYPKEEIIGHTPWEFSPAIQPDGKNSKESVLEKINQAHMGIPQYFYWQHKRKDNTLIDTEISLKNFIIAKKYLVQATIHDITERMRFEKIQNALYNISEAVNTTEDIQTLYSDIHQVIKGLMPADNFYIALYDEEANIITFPYFVDEFDHSLLPRKPAGGLTEYVLKTGRDLIIRAEEVLELRESGAVTLIGEPAAVWLGVVLRHEGHIKGVMAVQDYYNKSAFGEIEKQILIFVSEQIALAIDRKHTSDELINYTKQLKANKDLLEERARELAQLNSQLAESERRLKDLNLSKDKLFSIIAHDLKGPFQPLLGLSDILLEEYGDLTPEEITRFIKEINNILKNQYKLVENLLDWSRLQTGRMIYSPEKVNLFETVESNFEMFKPKSVHKNITLVNKVSQHLFAFADVYMLQSIIQNLVSNAIKFTMNGGMVTVSAECEYDEIIISIIDTGIGISKDDMDKIFRIDMQHTTLGTDDEKGTGLGLIICRELVEKNGGKIWIESESGKGTKFFFTVPKG